MKHHGLEPSFSRFLFTFKSKPSAVKTCVCMYGLQHTPYHWFWCLLAPRTRKWCTAWSMQQIHIFLWRHRDAGILAESAGGSQRVRLHGEMMLWAGPVFRLIAIEREENWKAVGGRPKPAHISWIQLWRFWLVHLTHIGAYRRVVVELQAAILKLSLVVSRALGAGAGNHCRHNKANTAFLTILMQRICKLWWERRVYFPSVNPNYKPTVESSLTNLSGSLFKLIATWCMNIFYWYSPLDVYSSAKKKKAFSIATINV